MYCSHAQLKAALAALDRARLTVRCQEPRRDADGHTGFESTGGARVPYGEHGGDFLEVDPVTGAVRCGACAGTLDATATPKQKVAVRGRTHMVSR